jgi:hypothetical protein
MNLEGGKKFGRHINIISCWYDVFVVFGNSPCARMKKQNVPRIYIDLCVTSGNTYLGFHLQNLNYGQHGFLGCEQRK